ncbi:MAG TPA: CocE/NonD family hydrolase, partial [Candidatus Polarisedimenticolia bacterium]|nr:CocE/NonD family hydrolase [Candidatus Polarisedimenticolia bacterium]
MRRRRSRFADRFSPLVRSLPTLRSSVVASAAVLTLMAVGCKVERPAGPPAGEVHTQGMLPPAGAGNAGHDDSPNMTIERNVAVPMRDGVILKADLYRPAAPGRYPTLVYRTPYGKDGLLESGSEPTLS